MHNYQICYKKTKVAYKNRKQPSNISWNDIYEIIIQNKNCKNCILGFFSYKLSILYGYQINKSIMIQYIKKYFME